MSEIITPKFTGAHLDSGEEDDAGYRAREVIERIRQSSRPEAGAVDAVPESAKGTAIVNGEPVRWERRPVGERTMCGRCGALLASQYGVVRVDTPEKYFCSPEHLA